MIVAHRFVSRENDPCVFPFAGIEPRGAAADVASSFQPIAAQICPEGFDHRPHQASLDMLRQFSLPIFEQPCWRNNQHWFGVSRVGPQPRSEEHTSAHQYLLSISSAIFGIK